jgi:YhcH/YjgK/YiaL family protein
MKKILLIIGIISFVMNTNAQSKREDWNTKKAKTWFEAGEWKNGWKIGAHPATDIKEFAYQYHKNKELWDKAFTFLKNTNLDTLSVGKHVLDGDNLFISVTEAPTKDFEATKWEAHKKYIDVQYIIKGKEKMGVVDVTKVTAIDPFNETKDVGFYTAPEKDAKYYEATPEAYLIFFPCDAHRPSIKVEGCDTTKKLVVKIKAN